MGGPSLVALVLVTLAHDVMEAEVRVAVVPVEPDAGARRSRFRKIEVRGLAHGFESRVRHEPKPEVPVLVGLERFVQPQPGVDEAAMEDAGHRGYLAVVVHDERVHPRLALDHDAMEAVEPPELRMHEPRPVGLPGAREEAGDVRRLEEVVVVEESDPLALGMVEPDVGGGGAD